jgi:hypothetical protein
MSPVVSRQGLVVVVEDLKYVLKQQRASATISISTPCGKHGEHYDVNLFCAAREMAGISE